MDRSLQEAFAKKYPTSQTQNTPENQKSKTPLNKVLNTKEKYFYKNEINQPISISKKIIIAIIISFIAAFLFSTIAYTFSDNITSGISLNLFDKDGQPGNIIIIIHTIILSLFVFLIINTITK